MEILPAFCVEHIRTVDICKAQEALFCSSCTSAEAIHLSLFRLHMPQGNHVIDVFSPGKSDQQLDQPQTGTLERASHRGRDRSTHAD